MHRRSENAQNRIGRRSAPEAQGDRVLYAWPPLLAALLVFLNTLGGEPVYDDAWKAGIFEGPAPSIGSLLRMSRGLTHAVHWLDHRVWGEWTAGFHLTNVALHALASVLAALLARAVSRSRRVGLLCGLFFAVHPVHVEAVASFTNRKDVLAMIFAALATLSWLAPRRPALGYAGALLCFALGLLSKEVAVVALAGMLFLADLWLGDDTRPAARRLPRAALRAAPFFAGGLLMVWRLGRQTGLGEIFSTDSIRELSEGQLASYGEVLANVAAAVVDNVRLLLFPLALSADHPLVPGTSFTDPKPLLGLVLAATWLLGTAWLAGRSPVAAWAMAWPAVMLLPLLNLVPLNTFFVAERYLYVPSFGVCLLAAWAVDRGLGTSPSTVRRQALAAGTLVLLVSGAARSVARNRDWHDGEALWSSSLRQGIRTWRVHSGYATALARQGRHAEAIEHFERSLDLLPSRVETWRVLAGTLAARTKPSPPAALCCVTIPTTPPVISSSVPRPSSVVSASPLTTIFAGPCAESPTIPAC